ncbi:peroxidase family protein [Modestobacter sp. URMC 112]
MPRLTHGAVPTTGDVEKARELLVERSSQVSLAFALAPPPVDVHDFDFLFPSLQADSANLLPQAPDTPQKLKALGRTMEDPDVQGGDNDAPIPAAYTYFGQFVDHDITLEVQDFPPPVSGGITALLDPALVPMPLAEIRNALRNFRSATLDLDSLYGLPAPRDPADGNKMRIGLVTELNETSEPFLRPPGKSDDNDLPREPRAVDEPLHDRAALIGDPRNDENTIVAQMHVAFLKAHNALVDEGRTFEEARRVLRQHYQHIVVHDFLKRVADPAVVDDVVTNGNRWFNALSEPFFMPLEFAVAAYRFGHSMVRQAYDFNVNFNLAGIPASLDLLFTFTALSGQIGAAPTDTDTLPENWIIEWENILGGPDVGKARRIDTRLAATGGRALFALTTLTGQVATPPDAARLAVRNLLRGYRLRIPTGQAVAGHLGLPVLTPAEIDAAAGSQAQVDALAAGGFRDRTPLWFYVLAEAKHHGGARLGPVGSVLVAEVLIGLVRRSEDSILGVPNWVPSLPGATPGTFELADLFRFAGVMGEPSSSTTYVVRAGDTLASIAKDRLGDRARWPEVFLLNRALIRHPDRIFAGQVLTLPSGPPMQPRPRIYVIRRGDTLSGIARRQLGDASRWPEIFALNSSVITNPDLIVPDTVLVLPS